MDFVDRPPSVRFGLGLQQPAEGQFLLSTGGGGGGGGVLMVTVALTVGPAWAKPLSTTTSARIPKMRFLTSSPF
jgi:hypothetical protein